MRYQFFLALACIVASCSHANDARAALKIEIQNHLAETKGKITPNSNQTIEMQAYSYPSLLKYYTDPELLGVLRASCDENAKILRSYRPNDSEVTLEWNFTARGKGTARATVQDIPRFGATLTELEPGVFRITCGERVY